MQKLKYFIRKFFMGEIVLTAIFLAGTVMIISLSGFNPELGNDNSAKNKKAAENLFH